MAQCQKAGIVVRMVTGDSILPRNRTSNNRERRGVTSKDIVTAINIARKCGILGDGELALEGPKFREMST